MLLKTNKIKLLTAFGLILFAFLNISCEKKDNKSNLEGTWDFNLSCNKAIFIACTEPSNLNYKNVLIFNNDVVTNKWDDSVIYSEKYSIDKNLITIGTSDNKLIKEFELKGNTLVLIDTCMACYINTYVRR